MGTQRKGDRKVSFNQLITAIKHFDISNTFLRNIKGLIAYKSIALILGYKLLLRLCAPKDCPKHVITPWCNDIVPYILLCLDMIFDRLQAARLELLTKLLKQREQNHAELNIKRLDKMWRKKQKEKEAFTQKVRHEHIRGRRKTKSCLCKVVLTLVLVGSTNYLTFVV